MSIHPHAYPSNGAFYQPPSTQPYIGWNGASVSTSPPTSSPLIYHAAPQPIMIHPPAPVYAMGHQSIQAQPQPQHFHPPHPSPPPPARSHPMSGQVHPLPPGFVPTHSPPPPPQQPYHSPPPHQPSPQSSPVIIRPPAPIMSPPSKPVLIHPSVVSSVRVGDVASITRPKSVDRIQSVIRPSIQVMQRLRVFEELAPESPAVKWILFAITCLVDLFKLCMASLLSIFVPQLCPGNETATGGPDNCTQNPLPHDCGFEENFRCLTDFNAFVIVW